MTVTEDEIAEQMTPEADEPDQTPLEDDGDGLEGERPDDDLAAQAQGRSQNEIEALQRKLDAEGERHAKRVAQIMGDDFALLVPSPVDWTPGFIFNVPQMHPTPEQVAALDALLGRDEDGEMLDAEDAQPCDKCDARGRTRTGSKVEGQRSKPCGKCNGSGWVVKLAAAPPLPAVTFAPGVGPSATPTPETYQVKDSWGRPAGHPHFGIDPVAIGA